MKVRVNVPSFSRPRRLARPRTSPFHGGNTGSNPVGDANKISQLDDIAISIKICGKATVTVDLRKAPPVSGRLPDGCRPDRVARRACLPDQLTPQPDRSSVWGPPRSKGR